MFDVIATSQDGSRTVSIQVKTRSVQNTQGWIMNEKMEDAISSKGKFVVFGNEISASAREERFH